MAMNGATDVVHGHTLMELAALLEETWPGIHARPSLSLSGSRGLSNVNLLGEVDGLRFVLKLPWRMGFSDSDPYAVLNDVSSHVAGNGLGPRPLAHGRFSDDNRTPFIALEYLDGLTVSSVQELAPERIQELCTALARLKSLKPPRAVLYETPRAYVDSLYGRLHGYSQDALVADGLAMEFNCVQDDLLDFSSEIQQWSGLFMHGDLHEGNIVFTEGGVRFLDLEDSAYGEPMIDLAYLRVQQPVPNPLHFMKQIYSPTSPESVRPYEPLALAFAVTWTIERLVALDMGLVEPSLAARYPRVQMVDYSRKKIQEIRAHF